MRFVYLRQGRSGNPKAENPKCESRNPKQIRIRQKAEKEEREVTACRIISAGCVSLRFRHVSLISAYSDFPFCVRISSRRGETCASDCLQAMISEMTVMLHLVARGSLTRSLSAFLVAALLAVFAPSLADAAQFNVMSVADDGPGSLRQALLDAVGTPGNDEVIVQSALGVINVTSELAWSGLSAPNAVTIEINGVRVDFNGAPRGFVDVGGAGVTIRNMEITGVGGTTNGGSVAAVSRGIIVFGVITIGDTAPVVSQGGAMVIEGCTIFDNHPRTPDGDVAGAMLSEGGPVTDTNCTFRDNTAEGPFDAATVLSEGGGVTVSGSLIENNSAQAGNNSGGRSPIRGR
jgi:hypothetical protein